MHDEKPATERSSALERLIIEDVLGKEVCSQFIAGKIPRKTLDPYISEIRELSDAYNFPHKFENTMLSSDKSLQAYMLYFMPVNFYKVYALLEKIKYPKNNKIKILDFGCGPGTASLAALSYLQAYADIFLFDISGNISKKAKTLIKAYLPSVKAEVLNEDWRNQKYDLILVANSINEIPDIEKEKTAASLVNSLNESGVLFILEPALKGKTRSAMRIRDYILSNFRQVSAVFPCTHNGLCPMLSSSEKDWCHGQLNWEAGRLVRQIDEITGFNKHRLKYSAFIFKNGKGESEGFRIVSIPKKDKRGLTLKLCGMDYYREVSISKGSAKLINFKKPDIHGLMNKTELAWKEIKDGALLIDNRTEEEYRAGHIEGSILIPHDQIESRLSEIGDDKDRSIVLYCRSGGRSGRAAEILKKHGYTKVLNAGGYKDLIAVT